MALFICILKTILCPFILILQAFRIYVLGCFGVYLERLGRGLLCGLCICCNKTFRDKSFPPQSSSIGPWKQKTSKQLDDEVGWLRIRDVCARSGQQGAALFSGDIHPGDICQGQLGDCWLMSACACLAGQEGAIQRVFQTTEYTAYGKYKVKLYDGIKKKWTVVVIDDWIPVSRQTKQAIFAKPNGDEAWVLLLEKAMAKFKGSYAALDGGSTLWALEALTGDFSFKLKLEPQAKSGRPAWARYELVHPNQPKGDVMLGSTKDVLASEEAFETLVYYARRKSVIACSSGGGDDSKSIQGIVQGHAYAILAAHAVGDIRLVKLRNPWGTFEWLGAWSDNAPQWKQNPKVARAVEFKADANDGCFWMAWADFESYFKNMDFCQRSTGWDDLRIDIHEESPCCGPVIGCGSGCCSFWFCCRGFNALFFNKQSRIFMRAPQGCCASCVTVVRD